MNRTFKEMSLFTKKWKELGLTDDDLRIFQEMLLKNPKIGDVIPGASGIRKIRIPLDGVGKRGGARVLYIDIEVRESIYLLDIYAKNEKTDLTEKEKKLLAKLVNVLKEE